MNFVNIKCITTDGRKKEREDWWFPYNETKDRFFNDVMRDLHSEKKIKNIKAGLKFIKGMGSEK